MAVLHVGVHQYEVLRLMGSVLRNPVGRGTEWLL